MKKILILVALFIFSASLLKGQGVFEKYYPTLGPLGNHSYHTAGVYFNGSSWIFYPWSSEFFTTKIKYCKIKINQDGTTEMVADSMGKTTWDFPFTVRDPRTGMSAQVFNGMLYLFKTNSKDSIIYYRTDGVHWSKAMYLGDTAMPEDALGNRAENLATAVMNGKLYLLKQNVNGGIKLFSSEDGETWRSTILFKNSDGLGPCSLALTTFIYNHKEHLLIGINKKKDVASTYWWDAKNGLYNGVGVISAGNGISLVTGRVNYGSDIEFLPVQILIKGTDDRIWIASFNPDNNTWLNLHHVAEIPSDNTYLSFPSAFTNFRYKSDGSLVKQVWVSSLTQDKGYNYFLGIYRVKSEVLKNTETVTTNCINYPSLWTLIGVVQGPPPFVLNGKSISDLNDPPSVFTYGSSQSSEVVNTIESKITTSISVSVPLAEGVLTAGFDMTAALSDFKSTSYSTSYSYGTSVVANNDKKSYLYFIVPTITRYKYESFTPSGDSTGEYEYLFAVTGASLTSEERDLTRFDPSNIESYKGKDPVGYTKISQNGFFWRANQPWESEFATSSTTEQTYSGSIEIGANMEIPDILKVSASYELTLSETHTTTFGKSITISIDCPNPRSGHKEDVQYFHGTAYWLKAPSDGNAFWIPKKYSNQRPWCVTWAIDTIEYNNVTDVKDNAAVPNKFELSQNYPNPFNPSTKINYSIAKAGFVTLKVYNMLGQQTTELVRKYQIPGRYSVDFRSDNLASGVYIYRLEVNNRIIDAKTMTLLK